MFTESCVTFFCRPEPFKVSFCEIVYRPPDAKWRLKPLRTAKKNMTQDSVDICSERLLNLVNFVFCSKSKLALCLSTYFLHTRHRSMFKFHQYRVVCLCSQATLWEVRSKPCIFITKAGDWGEICARRGEAVAYSLLLFLFGSFQVLTLQFTVPCFQRERQAPMESCCTPER